MELSNKQKEIVYSNAENVLVISAAAAGKTRVITERVRYLLQHGVKSNEIVLITFTNMAAEEMSKRIGMHQGMYIGTFHGYVNQLLKRIGIDTNSCIANEEYDELFELGFEHPQCAKPIKYLLIDEAQDLSEIQFQFVFDILKPQHFFIVGDARQSIYGFRGSRPDLLLSLKQREDTTTYDLNENYRNGKKILEFAKRIIDKVGLQYEDNSINMNPVFSKVIEDDYSKELVYDIIFQNTKDNYKDWFILSRYNEFSDECFDYLTKKGIPCELFTREDMNNENLKTSLRNNTVKIMTIHAAKGLESKNVIVIGTKFWCDEERRISYVAATRAKETLYWLKENKVPFAKKKQQTKNKIKMSSWE